MPLKPFFQLKAIYVQSLRCLNIEFKVEVTTIYRNLKGSVREGFSFLPKVGRFPSISLEMEFDPIHN